MHPSLHLLAAGTVLAAFASAQQSILFTGRFPFVGVDAPNERPGGAMNRIEEFDLSAVLALPGAPARSLLPATAMQCYLGDADANGSYTKFGGWKTYFQAINIGGIFVKASDRNAVTWDKLFFTLRRNGGATGTASPGALQFEVFSNGAPYVVTAGDWLRLLPNGNCEFFLTAAQLSTAVGTQPGAASIGAGALLQANNGDLYYSPVDGGHWVNGSGVPAFAQDGAIIKIDAANITYNAAGNVASLAPNSARLIINEAATGPGGSLTVRQMTLNSGSVDRFGNAIVATSYGKTVGLAFDPNGGTFTSLYPDATSMFTNEPNLLFCSDGGAYAGTIWSTASNGTVAVIGLVTCGSTTVGVPANGSWLGVQLDTVNFQPTMMGFTLADSVSSGLVIDQNDFGRLPLATSQPSWDIDMSGIPGLPVFVLASVGNNGVGGFLPSVPTALVPGLFTTDSWRDIFLQNPFVTIGVAVTSPFGYGTVSVPNPNNGGLTNANVVLQAIGLGPQFQLSSPICVQLQ